MASSDVIELGSSDDEAEPVPKKKKPTPNAMVQFPNKMPGLVIKPPKPPPPDIHKVLAGRAVTVTNVKKGKANTQINKAKSNSRPVLNKDQLSMPMTRQIPVSPIRIRSNLSPNPYYMMKNPSFKGHPPKISFPPGLIVKKAAVGQSPLQNVCSVPNRNKNNSKRNQPDNITTVELDDDEVPLTSGTGPQWYLRPEEQTSHPAKIDNDISEDNKSNVIEKSSDMEVENNKEPDTINYIEITIEDSPMKSIQRLADFEVGSQIPIIIEDSPVKPAKSVKEQPCVSDGEAEKISTKEPHSKKKLDYPQNEDNLLQVQAQNIVEIDLEIVPTANDGMEESEDKNTDVADKATVDVKDHKIGSHRRVSTVLITNKLKDKEETSNLTSKLPLENNDSSEFHPTYQKFIDLCLKLENSDDMKKIVEKKIKTYYRQCPKEYVQSEEFTDMVSSKIFAMKATPDKMYLYIKDIVDELNLQRKTAKALGVSQEENNKAVQILDAGEDLPQGTVKCIAEDVEFDSKRSRQIRKLDKTIKKLHRAVQKLEEQEVEFEDEEDSVYLLTERYKERLIRVHAKFCQLTNTKMPSEPRIQIEPRPGQPPGPARRLEKWVNKKVPIGKPLPFPDFHDVLRCVRDANDEDRLGWNDADIMEEARDLFTRCGKTLQRRRQENEWRIAASRISHDISALDPAAESDDLKKKLEENKSLASKKEAELLNKYADKQNQLKLVGEEIGDKEAEESPVESEDDDDESNSLEDKQKRKEMLRRLLHEKTRKLSSDKENVTNVDVKVNKEDNQLKKQEISDIEVTAPLNKTDNTEQEYIQDKTTEVEDIINESTVDNFQDGASNVEKQETINDNKFKNCNDHNNEKCNNSDLYDLDSDIDELHLLQKLYYENEIISSNQESDSDTPIAISDTLDSGSDIENVEIHQNDDIISIENSSYSESEINKDECERTTESQVVNDEKIDSLLAEDTEMQVYSLKDKIDVEDEDVLLASSGDENDKDDKMIDKNNKTNCETRMSNNIANNDYPIIDVNCVESSLKNNIITGEASQREKAISKVEAMLVEQTYDVNILDDKGLTNEQPTELQENVTEVDESMNSEVSIEKDNDNSKVISSSRADLLRNDIACNKTDKTLTEHEDKDIFEKPSNKFEENYSEGNQINQSCIDKVEINEMASTDINSEHSKDDIIECTIKKLFNITDEDKESTSHIVKTLSTEQEINECEK